MEINLYSNYKIAEIDAVSDVVQDFKAPVYASMVMRVLSQESK
jgi:hypothetical protein